MDLFLKHPQYLKGEFFVTNSDFFAICPHTPGPSISGLCFEYETMLKINENKDGYFDFSKALIDIGSEDGGYAIFCNFAYNYCFEANKQMCSLIYTNMYLKDKVDNTEVYNVFLGDNTDEIMFNGFSSEGGVNYDSRGRHENKKVRKHLLDEYNIKNVGLIKTDTEGFDYFVLKGGINTIKNNNYPPILFENWPVDYMEGSDVVWTKEKHDRLNNFLTDLGYTILEGWSDNMTHLAVNRKYYEKENERVVVSMTTIPSRKSTLIDNLMSILNQTFRFDKFCINIDDDMSVEDYEFYFGLEKLDSRIEVNICDRKWRSCNKLLPTIKKYPYAVIITVDDDICYPENTLNVLFEEYKKNQDCIITAASNPIMINDNGYYNGYFLLNDVCLKQKNYSKYMSLCTLFPPNVFSDTEVFDYDKMMQITNGVHDELWFWLNSTLKGVKVITEDNYLRNLECYISDYTYGNGYKLCNTNFDLDVLKKYVEDINYAYGEKLKDILSEKIEFIITRENLYNLFYNWDNFKLFYDGNFILNTENLTKGMIKELTDFLKIKGCNVDYVIKK